MLRTSDYQRCFIERLIYGNFYLWEQRGMKERKYYFVTQIGGGFSAGGGVCWYILLLLLLILLVIDELIMI